MTRKRKRTEREPTREGRRKKPEPESAPEPNPTPEANLTPEPGAAGEEVRPRPTWPAPREPAVGIECPACGCRHFHVLYTRAFTEGRILRRRECRYCGRRLSTVEMERPA